MRSVLASGEPTKNDPPLHLASKTGHVEIVRYGQCKAQVVSLYYVMFHSSNLSKLPVILYILRVKIKFRLKLCNLGWFQIPLSPSPNS